ncbi:MAG: hypothetical protein FJY88_09695 [Candidatus Eisenbacteria bacterium]|nr:hypothetical protein [Candidatus Eisenbacteria bacterium]
MGLHDRWSVRDRGDIPRGRREVAGRGRPGDRMDDNRRLRDDSPRRPSSRWSRLRDDRRGDRERRRPRLGRRPVRGGGGGVPHPGDRRRRAGRRGVGSLHDRGLSHPGHVPCRRPGVEGRDRRVDRLDLLRMRRDRPRRASARRLRLQNAIRRDRE